MGKLKGNKRVVRFRQGSFHVVLDAALVASVGIQDGDIVEEFIQGPGTITIRRTGERVELPKKKEEADG